MALNTYYTSVTIGTTSYTSSDDNSADFASLGGVTVSDDVITITNGVAFTPSDSIPGGNTDAVFFNKTINLTGTNCGLHTSNTSHSHFVFVNCTINITSDYSNGNLNLLGKGLTHSAVREQNFDQYGNAFFNCTFISANGSTARPGVAGQFVSCNHVNAGSNQSITYFPQFNSHNDGFYVNDSALDNDSAFGTAFQLQGDYDQFDNVTLVNGTVYVNGSGETYREFDGFGGNNILGFGNNTQSVKQLLLMNLPSSNGSNRSYVGLVSPKYTFGADGAIQWRRNANLTNSSVIEMQRLTYTHYSDVSLSTERKDFKTELDTEVEFTTAGTHSTIKSSDLVKTKYPYISNTSGILEGEWDPNGGYVVSTKAFPILRLPVRVIRPASTNGNPGGFDSNTFALETVFTRMSLWGTTFDTYTKDGEGDNSVVRTTPDSDGYYISLDTRDVVDVDDPLMDGLSETITNIGEALNAGGVASDPSGDSITLVTTAAVAVNSEAALASTVPSTFNGTGIPQNGTLINSGAWSSVLSITGDDETITSTSSRVLLYSDADNWAIYDIGDAVDTDGTIWNTYNLTHVDSDGVITSPVKLQVVDSGNPANYTPPVNPSLTALAQNWKHEVWDTRDWDEWNSSSYDGTDAFDTTVATGSADSIILDPSATNDVAIGDDDVTFKVNTSDTNEITLVVAADDTVQSIKFDTLSAAGSNEILVEGGSYEGTFNDLKIYTSAPSSTETTVKDATLEGTIEVERPTNSTDVNYINLSNCTIASGKTLTVNATGSGAGTVEVYFSGTNDGTLTAGSNVSISQIVNLTFTLPSGDAATDEVTKFRYYTNSSDTALTSPTWSDAQSSEISVDGSVITITLALATDQTHIWYALDYEQHELFGAQAVDVTSVNASLTAGQQVGIDWEQNLSSFTNNGWDFSPSAISMDAVSSSTDNINVTLDDTAVTGTATNNSTRTWMRRVVMAQDRWLEAVAQGFIPVAIITFPSAAITIITDEKDRITFDHTSSNSVFKLGARAVDEVGADLAEELTTTLVNTRILFTADANGATGAEINEILDERALTQNNVGNLGLLKPAKDTSGTILTGN